jgi:uncharacterized membrane protein
MKTIAQQINWDFKINGVLEIRNQNDKRIYIENSKGYWSKREYDSEGNEIYFENSDGNVEDNRPKLSVVEIDGVKYKLTKL